MNWGKDYQFTKIYHGFRQWCQPLTPGMKVIQTKLAGPAATGISQPGLKAAAFITEDGSRIVVHAAAIGEIPIPMRLMLEESQATSAQRYRTSNAEDMAKLTDLDLNEAGALIDTLPAGSMMTWIFQARAGVR